VAKKAYDAFVSEQVGRKSKEELFSKAKKLISFMKLYAKGLEVFEDDEARAQLEKYLLRNFGQEIINALTEFFLIQAGIEDGKVSHFQSKLTFLSSLLPVCILLRALHLHMTCISRLLILRMRLLWGSCWTLPG